VCHVQVGVRYSTSARRAAPVFQFELSTAETRLLVRLSNLSR